MLGGVAKTSVLTLRARADEHARADRVFEDRLAAEWLSRIEWPSELDRWYSPRVQSFLAFRAHEIDTLLAEHVKKYPDTRVVELGCGLSSRFSRVPASEWIDLDLPEVIETRRALGIEGRQLACSVLDRSWIGEAGDPSRLFIIAEGLFYYLPRSEVDALFADLRAQLAGAVITFDVLGDMDWELALQNSSSAGTPVQWKIDPPFERALEDFGLEPVPGWEPKVLMERAIDRYWRRFGSATYLAVKLASRVEALAGKRSGNLIGRLRAAERR